MKHIRKIDGPTPRIHCDDRLYCRIAGDLHNALVGKPVLAGDSLMDLVQRHCPELFEICAANGFKFVPNPEARFLEKRPPDFWFDIVRPDWAVN